MTVATAAIVRTALRSFCPSRPPGLVVAADADVAAAAADVAAGAADVTADADVDGDSADAAAGDGDGDDDVTGMG